MPGGRGEGGARGQGLISFAPGRSGHHACRHYDRRAGCAAGSGAEPAVISAALAKHPTKPGPDRTKGLHTPWQEPRWNAGRRARPERMGRRKPTHSVARPAPAGAGMTQCVCRRSASLISFVARMNEVKSGSGMKARRSCPDIAPLIRATGYGPFRHRCLTSLARGVRARERDRIASAPTQVGEGGHP